MQELWAWLRLSHLKDTLSEVSKRFLLPFLLTFIVSGIFIFLIFFNENHNTLWWERIFRMGISGIVTFFLWVSLNFFLEQKKSSYRFLWQWIPLVFYGVFYYFYDDIESFENIVFLFLTLVWFASWMFFTAFLCDLKAKIYAETQYYNFVYKISVAILYACIFWILIMLGGFLAIMALDLLFDIVFISNDKLYMTWMVLSTCLFAPILGLKHLPKKELLESVEFYENKFYSFLVQFVAIPFVILYFVILYAYSVKVLLNFWNWPRGEVVWLVIWFSLVGFIAYLFSFRYQEESAVIRLFRSVFPFAVFPQLAMLFYAISLRISQYDLTVNRYFVVVFWLVLLILSLYYIFSKEKKLIVIPATLALAIFVISIGPWWVYSLPESRQYQRLMRDLTQAKILQGTSIVPLTDDALLSNKESENISSEIRYLCDFNNCASLRSLFASQIEAEDRIRREKHQQEMSQMEEKYQYEYTPISRYEIASIIISYLNVDTSKISNLSQPYVTFFTEGKESFPLNVSGYDLLVNVHQMTQETALKWVSLGVDVWAQKLNILENSEVVETISLIPFNQSLYQQYASGASFSNQVDQLEYAFTGTKFDGKLLMSSRSMPNPKLSWGDTNTYFNVNGQALLKKK